MSFRLRPDVYAIYIRTSFCASVNSMKKKWQYCQKIFVRTFYVMQVQRDFYLRQLIERRQNESLHDSFLFSVGIYPT